MIVLICLLGLVLMMMSEQNKTSPEYIQRKYKEELEQWDGLMEESEKYFSSRRNHIDTVIKEAATYNCIVNRNTGRDQYGRRWW